MLLSLAGIPLTFGFIGKFYIFAAGVDGRLWGLLLAFIFGSGLGLYYYLMIVIIMSMNPESSPIEDGVRNRAWATSAALTVLTILLVWLGGFPERLITLIQAL